MPSSRAPRICLLVFVLVLLALLLSSPFVFRSLSSSSSFSNPFPGQCGRRLPVEARIGVIGGVDARAGLYPWHADFGGCGGAIVGRRRVVTAAHCAAPFLLGGVANGSFVYAGNLHPGDYDYDPETEDRPESADQALQVIDVRLHPCFCNESPCPPLDGCDRLEAKENDLAVVITKEEFVFNDKVQPICLPAPDATFPPGTPAELSGFGRTNRTRFDSWASTLQGIQIPLVGANECRRILESLDRGMRIVDDAMICSGSGRGVGSCHGDSGGPLAVEVDGVFHLYGIVSWGSADCDAIGVYTRVSRYVDWILEEIKSTR